MLKESKDVKNNPNCGRLTITRTAVNVEHVIRMVYSDRRSTVQLMISELGMD